jgi:hypothetical protein
MRQMRSSVGAIENLGRHSLCKKPCKSAMGVPVTDSTSEIVRWTFILTLQYVKSSVSLLSVS